MCEASLKNDGAVRYVFVYRNARSMYKEVVNLYCVRIPWAVLAGLFFFIPFCRSLNVSCGCCVSCLSLCILTWREGEKCKVLILLSAGHLFFV